MIRSLLLFAVVIVSFMVKAEAETLTILHTNDLHARIEPVNQYNNICTDEGNTGSVCFGGYARLAAAVQTEREKSGHSILVDGGDQFQGSLMFTHYQGQALVGMMNRVRYDGMTVGNHEFDLGPQALRRFIQQAEFPVLLSNVDISEEPLLNDILKPSAVIEKNGYRYGLIGLAPVNTVELSSPGPNTTFTDPVRAISREISNLTSQGIDRVILLSHSGYDVDQHIAASVDGIDVIVGGHTNTFLSNQDDEQSEGPYPTWVKSPNGTAVAIVQAYAYGKYLGRLDVTFDDRGRIISAMGNPILLDGRITQNQKIRNKIAELAKPLNELRNQVISKAVNPIDGIRTNCQIRECKIGNLVADAMLAQMKSQGYDIAITNAGGLRSSIDQGEITMGEVLAVYPFQNRLSSFELTGADILASLESGVSLVEKESGRFPQVSGLRFRYSRMADNDSAKVYDVEVDQGNQ
ncbi:MAG: multifunctional 2',3'-cyclic-nucleotide 2'-phosphodiesterase/5'-nucleotidase/3'-nucleotidase, partial [Gammaproteobacteria bacterium]|nr:multifunctional 2',3'-cyclic-nucleotide 2'-phosphodiesterase/5'-nucleotidase/3'-nucleotidase [Gammaproteobacteria bacterium]